MIAIDVENAAEHLRGAGVVERAEPLEICELTGGVSNLVLLVERPSRPAERFVLKQARHQLRTREPWFSRLERIWREIEVLAVCDRLLESSVTTPCPACGVNPTLAISTPRILHVDRANYWFAMTAAGRDARVWKADLLGGRVDPRIAAACGHLLGQLHAASWNDRALSESLGDRSLFDELRIDPYYRTVARAHPELAPQIARLIDALQEHSLALVQADFSPKNLLVSEAGLMMVDFETGHFGDPAFDIGFFLSHLLLKAIYHAPDHEPLLDLADVFVTSYRRHARGRLTASECDSLFERGLRNLGGCLVARIDGKSPIDYLPAPAQRAVAVRLGTELLCGEAVDWEQAMRMCRAELH